MEQILRAKLQSRFPDKYTFLYYDELDSTNTLLKQLAKENAKNRTFIVANSQLSGRGQRQRNFFSPPNEGLYFSFLHREKMPLSQVELMTPAVAVACRRAILKVTGVATRIKWVNDLYFDEKKLVGILCESVFSPEGLFDYCVIGIGINCHTKAFPEALHSIATSVDLCGGQGYTRTTLILALLQELEDALHSPDHRLQEYRDHCKTLGEWVSYEEQGQLFKGKAIAIDDHGGLVIALNSGEIVTKLTL